jgi:site-specific recombinase XerD
VTRSRRVRRAGQLDAGPFAADIASFRLHLAAENKAAGTVRIYCDAACWFAASHLLAETDKTRWGQVGAADVRRWVAWLLGRYSEAYAYQQYRSLQQFFRWLAVEEDLPSPMAKLRPPKVTGKPVPFFSSVELSKLGRCCRGNSFDDRRDAAVLALFLATGIRVSELAAIRYCGDDPDHSDVDLEARAIKVRGKGGRDRIVKISHEAARRLDRYLRVRSRHELAYRPELWLGAGNRGPLDRSGIYQLCRRSFKSWPGALAEK